jgi:hypothetical protein
MVPTIIGSTRRWQSYRRSCVGVRSSTSTSDVAEDRVDRYVHALGCRARLVFP